VSQRREGDGGPREGGGKVLMICTADLTVPTATRVHFLSVARGFRRRGRDVELFCVGDVPVEYGLTVNAVAPRPARGAVRGRLGVFARHFALLLRHLPRLRRTHHDFIYIRTSSLTLPAVLVAKCLLRGPVVTEHNGWIADEGRVLGLPRWSAWAQARLQRAEARVSDLVRGVTLGMKRILVEEGIAWEKIFVVGNGTDTTALRPVDKAAACARMGLSADRPTVGFVGNLVPWQGIERLLAVMPALLAEVPDLLVVVAGGGASLESLERRADELGVAHAVHFHGWFPHEQAGDLINCFDVAVAPFVEERNARVGLSPLKIRDYAACGRAIVTTRLPGLAELGAEGVLVDCDTSDPNVLAAELLTLLRDPDRRAELGARARAKAEADFDWQAIADAILDAVASGPARARPLAAHVIPSLQTGGAERMLTNYLTHSDGAGLDHAVVALMGRRGFADAIELRGIPVIELGMDRTVPSALGALCRLRRALRALDPDVLDGWMYHGIVFGWLGMLGVGRRNRGPRARLIQIRCTLMQLDKYGLALKANYRLSRRLAHRATEVVYNSNAGRRQHIEAGFPAEKALVVRNGVDTGLFRPDPAARARLREEWGVGPDEVLVCTVARYDPMKGYDLLARAADALAGTCRFVAAGLDTERKLLPHPNLIRLGMRRDIPAVLAACDVFCLPSTFGEGFPNVVIEAMATGLVPVAFDVGESAEIVGEYGVVARPITAEALREALAEAVTRLRADLPPGPAIRASVVERYGIDRAVATYDGLYRRLSGLD